MIDVKESIEAINESASTGSTRKLSIQISKEWLAMTYVNSNPVLDKLRSVCEHARRLGFEVIQRGDAELDGFIAVDLIPPKRES